MPRIRSIKPEFWTSEQIMSLSLPARLLFIGLWNFCDDAGRHRMSVRQLLAQVFPGDREITLEQARGWIDELIANGLVIEYEAIAEDGAREEFWQVTGWAKHQYINRPRESKYPPPPANSVSVHAGHTEDTRRDHGEITEGSRRAPCWKGMEGIKDQHQSGTIDETVQTDTPEPVRASEDGPTIPRAMVENPPGKRRAPSPKPAVPVNGTRPTPPTPLPTPELTIPLADKTEFTVQPSDIEEWAYSFPGVNIAQELRAIRQWNLDHPTKRKTQRGIRAHISSWLHKTQNESRALKPAEVNHGSIYQRR